jgi:hypothetical protein
MRQLLNLKRLHSTLGYQPSAPEETIPIADILYFLNAGCPDYHQVLLPGAAVKIHV